MRIPGTTFSDDTPSEKEQLREENRRLRQAIETHRAQKADDRCIDDDDVLYAALGDGIKCDRRVGSKEEMLKNCARFIDRRCEGGKWSTYAELEARLSSDPVNLVRMANLTRHHSTLSKRILRLMAELGELSEAFGSVESGNYKKKTLADVREEVVDTWIVATDILLTSLPNEDERELHEIIDTVLKKKLAKWMKVRAMSARSDDDS